MIIKRGQGHVEATLWSSLPGVDRCTTAKNAEQAGALGPSLQAELMELLMKWLELRLGPSKGR